MESTPIVSKHAEPWETTVSHQSLPILRAGEVRGYQVGAELFPRKDDLLARVRHILYTTPLNAMVAEAQLAFLLALLAHHPDARRKVGVGIVAMHVRRNPKYRPNRGFWAIRADGSETDWSLMQCIYPTTTMQLLRAAFRHAVLAQTTSFKQEQCATHANTHGEVCCPVEQIWVGARDAHVDHIPPRTMERLIVAFLAAQHLAPEDVTLSVPRDGSIGRTLADPALRRTWRAYHHAHARLRVVSGIANLSTIRRSERAARRHDQDTSGELMPTAEGWQTEAT